MKTLNETHLEEITGGFEPLTMPPGWDQPQFAGQQAVESFLAWWSNCFHSLGLIPDQQAD